MVYIVTTIIFPSHKAPEAAKKFLEALSKYPEDESLGETAVNAAIKTSTFGIRVLNVATVKKGKLEESLTRGNEILAMYNEIEGFEYTMEVWQEPAEALATLGMKMPE
ncbi:MAG: hypothetical protein KAV01_05110 [Candidatus Lokiarchaeota archaeon]|nr:hypothetical protein [Candidatus Lokiarchaeota archaeon]